MKRFIILTLLIIFALFNTPTLAHSPVIWEVDEIRVPVYHSEVIVLEKENNIIPRWPESLEEVELWLQNNSVPLIGGWSLYHDPENDCEDIAERRMFMASEDGLYLPVCPVYLGDVFGEEVSKAPAWKHVGNWFWLGNNYYFIESRPSDPKIIKLKQTVKD